MRCLASAYNASVTNGIFESNGAYAYARAAEVMSTQSETDFEWSVYLVGHYLFVVGIASQLKWGDSYIFTYDQDSILCRFLENDFIIGIGNNIIHKNLPRRTGNVIRFKFQSQRKKLVIDLVRI